MMREISMESDCFEGKQSLFKLKWGDEIMRGEIIEEGYEQLQVMLAVLQL